MAIAILQGVGGGGGKTPQQKSIKIIKNGDYPVHSDEGYELERVDIKVETPEPKEEQEKIVNITDNGDFEVTPDEGKVLNRVYGTVNVPKGEDLDTEISEQKTLIAQIKSALAGKAAGGGSPTPTQEKNVEITENGDVEVVPDEGYALSKVMVNVNVPIPEGSDPKALLDASLNNTLTDIDSNVTSVVAYACRGLSKLKTVNLPNATSIGTYAFYYCTAMTSFNAPKVKTLGTYALYNSAIKSANFPLATSVPSQCFYSCNSLTKADFGVASSIAASAFAYAGVSVLILRIESEICTLTNKNALTDTPIADGTGYVYVPSALLDTYKAATNWSAFANQFRAIEDYPEICG